MAAKSDTDNGSPRDSGIAHDKNPGDDHAPGTEDNIHFNHLNEDVYGPWMVVTPKRHGARNNKRGSGSTSPRASFNTAKFQAQGVPPQIDPTIMPMSKEGKRKMGEPEVGPKEPIKLGSVSNSLAKDLMASPNSIKIPCATKRKASKVFTRANTSLSQSVVPIQVTPTPVLNAKPLASMPTYGSNGEFQFSSSSVKEVGNHS